MSERIEIDLSTIAARTGATLEQIVAAAQQLLDRDLIQGQLLQSNASAPDGTETTEAVLVLAEDDLTSVVERLAAYRQEQGDK